MRSRSPVRMVAALALAALVAPRPAWGEPPAVSCPPCPSTVGCLDGAAELHVAPWGVALEASAGIGLFFTTHGNVRLSIGRRFWERLEIEAAAQLLAGSQLTGVGGSLRAGLLLHLSRRWELLLAWRLGYLGFNAALPADTFWVGGLNTSVVIEAKLFLSRTLEVRLAPVVATGYWNRLWGMVVEPTLGLAYRF